MELQRITTFKGQASQDKEDLVLDAGKAQPPGQETTREWSVMESRTRECFSCDGAIRGVKCVKEVQQDKNGKYSVYQHNYSITFVG